MRLTCNKQESLGTVGHDCYYGCSSLALRPIWCCYVSSQYRGTGAEIEHSFTRELRVTGILLLSSVLPGKASPPSVLVGANGQQGTTVLFSCLFSLTMRLSSSSRCAASQHQTSLHLSHTPAVAPAAPRQQQWQHAAASSTAKSSSSISAAFGNPLAASTAARAGARVAVVVGVGNGATPFSAQTATAAAATATSSSNSSLSGSSAGPDADSSTSSSAGAAQQQQEGPDSIVSNTWEEEIEETLKLVQLLPPSGETCAVDSGRGVLGGVSGASSLSWCERTGLMQGRQWTCWVYCCLHPLCCSLQCCGAAL